MDDSASAVANVASLWSMFEPWPEEGPSGSAGVVAECDCDDCDVRKKPGRPKSTAAPLKVHLSEPSAPAAAPVATSSDVNSSTVDPSRDLTPLEIIMRIHAAQQVKPRPRIRDEREVERPPPQAVLAPLKERQWTAASQRRILQHELLGVALYRHLSVVEDMAMLRALEVEFGAFLADEDSQEPDSVYCLTFPTALDAHGRYLVHACAARFHLPTATFAETTRPFIAVYKHPRDAMVPVLRLSDYTFAASYYTPPELSVASYEPQRKYARYDGGGFGGGRGGGRGGGGGGGGGGVGHGSHVQLDAISRPLVGDFSRWLSPSFGSQAEPSSYECEIDREIAERPRAPDRAATPPDSSRFLLIPPDSS